MYIYTYRTRVVSSRCASSSFLCQTNNNTYLHILQINDFPYVFDSTTRLNLTINEIDCIVQCVGLLLHSQVFPFIDICWYSIYACVNVSIRSAILALCFRFTGSARWTQLQTTAGCSLFFVHWFSPLNTAALHSSKILAASCKPLQQTLNSHMPDDDSVPCCHYCGLPVSYAGSHEPY